MKLHVIVFWFVEGKIERKWQQGMDENVFLLIYTNIHITQSIIFDEYK